MMNYKEPEKAIPGRLYQAGSLSAQIITMPTDIPDGLTAGKAVLIEPGDVFVNQVPEAGETFLGIAMAPDSEPPNTERCAIVAKGYVWAICAEDIEVGQRCGITTDGRIASAGNSTFVPGTGDGDNLLCQVATTTLASGIKIAMIFVKPITNIQVQT